ncbi:hypothetical protein GY45DRAFT_1109795 [Cubamyces sp. BRFM 1775]|nr:hypothetical protein GY45DRAFT_1109795 [Cubamyces sp. BRFM 1775]
MARFFALVLAFSSLLVGTQVLAAPASGLIARQVGDLQCNIDRLSIVADLAATQNTLKKVQTDVASDATASSSVQSAIDSIDGAQGAIGVIAKALLTGQAAPAEARTQVQGNLTAAHDALTSIDSTSSNLQKALTQLGNAELAGEGVVNNCK